jgi:hypothetical protein
MILSSFIEKFVGKSSFEFNPGEWFAIDITYFQFERSFTFPSTRILLQRQSDGRLLIKKE